MNTLDGSSSFDLPVCPNAEGWGPWSNLRILDFTTCFEDFVISTCPMIFFSVFSIPRILKLIKRPAPSTDGWGGHYWAKIINAGLILFLYIISFICSLSEVENLPASLTSVVVFHGFCLVAVWIFTHYEHTRSVRDSNVLLVFWLSFLIASLIKLRTMVSLGIPSSDSSAFALFTISTICSFVQFILENLKKDRNGYMRVEEEGLNDCPEENANIFSLLTFWWLNKLMKLGHEKPLTMDDLWNVNRADRSRVVSQQFQKYWQRETQKAKPSLLRACVKAFGGTFFLAAFFKFTQDVMAFIQPQLLRRLMQFISSYQTNETDISEGLSIAISMLLTAMVQSLCLHQYFQRTIVSGMRLRSSLITAIYEKSLRLSSTTRQQYTVGEIVNHMSVDAQRFNDICSYLHIVWSGPFQIFMALYFLYLTLGPSTFAGVAIMILMFPVNAVLARAQQRLQKKQMANKDTRSKLMNEVLSGIKVIKLYAWEGVFLKRILDVRNRELNILKKYGYLGAINGFTWVCTPFMVSFATFALYVVIGDEPLTSEKAFTSLALFNLLQFPLAMFPMIISSIVEATVALNRLYNYLLSEEIDPKAVKHEPAPASSNNTTSKGAKKEMIARIKNGNFSWTKDGDDALKGINLEVAEGELMAVVGKVGSGKSSLIHAILGEMYKDVNSSVTVRGTVAYVSDSAWILNATIRENIVFGHRFDERFYAATLKACALEADLAILPEGDLCEVGERGVNLSGGQKKRLTLARAVYARADLYLLDDPLSAVDAHVGKHILNNVFGADGLLKDKARVLVTHGVHYLPKVDIVVVLSDGEISELGTFSELMNNSDGEFSKLIGEYGVQDGSNDTSAPPSPTKSDSSGSASNANHIIPAVAAYASQRIRRASEEAIDPSKKPDYVSADLSSMKKKPGQMVQQEAVATGSVSKDVYVVYAKACSIPTVVVFIISMLIAQACSIGSNVWLQYWSSQNNKTGSNQNVTMYLGVYAAIGLVFACFVVIQTLLLTIFCAIRCSRVLHESMLRRIIRAPMSFFDTQPIGRTLNRFSKDQNVVDEVLPRSFQMYFRTLISVSSVLIVISTSTPYFMTFVIPIAFLYYVTQKYYLGASRELKRLDSVSKSPMFSHFSETLDGIQTIRAYQQQLRFIAENNHRLDENVKAYYPSVSANRWLAVRLEFLGGLVIFGSALFAVLEVAYGGNIDAGVVGLSVSYALTVTNAMNWMVRQYCEIETNIVSVERIKQYLEVETEAPAVTDFRPPASWPDKGVIDFSHYSTRYREGLDLVLQDLTLRINDHEKVGIVGRTGSGKSSTTLSLFRIIEAVRGKISIDGIDISKLGLHDLRSRITIIPQDPTVFTGTVRENIDPFETADDADIWDALESVRLKDYVSSLPNKLNTKLSQGGGSFSLGQRQLLCLARALLRRTKVLVLDEATAQIDVETDSIIQETIRREFKNCTVLTIAHRIITVLDSDKILVLEKGNVMEFDTPEALLVNEDGYFSKLVKESGLSVADSSPSKKSDKRKKTSQ